VAQYTPKPTVTIDALQWDGTNSDAMNTFLLSVTANVDVRWSFTADTDHTEMMIKAHGEVPEQPVLDTDWVVLDDQGNLFPMDDATFTATYQAAP
jgi:hypothetical protein